MSEMENEIQKNKCMPKQKSKTNECDHMRHRYIQIYMTHVSRSVQMDNTYGGLMMN